MNISLSRLLLTSLVLLTSIVSADVLGNIKVCALRVNFQIDDHESTSGDGSFLDSTYFVCDNYTIDPPPHDKSYFTSQLKAVDSYYRNVSYNLFGIDLNESQVYPVENNDSYSLENTMNYYNPYNEDELQESRLTELLKDAANKAYEIDSIEFSSYDLIVVFHAGIGQDFSLPFLDPTPEDIPSTYVDPNMINTYLNNTD